MWIQEFFIFISLLFDYLINIQLVDINDELGFYEW